MSVPPETAADGPVYRSGRSGCGWRLTCCRPIAPAALPAGNGAGLRETLLALLGSADLADKTWVTQQYDAVVRGNTVLAMPISG